MKEDAKRLLQSWKEIMKEFLDATTLMEKLPTVFVFGSENFLKVYNRRREPHAAVEIAFNLIMESDIVFDNFIDGVRQCDHDWLADLISGCIKDEDVEKAAEKTENCLNVRKILNQFTPNLKKIMRAMEVAETLRADKYGGIITDEEFQNIECAVNQHGNLAAIRTLIIFLTRKPPGWWVHFANALEDNNYDADLVDSFRVQSGASATQYASSDISGEDRLLLKENNQIDDGARPLGPSNNVQRTGRMAANFSGMPTPGTVTEVTKPKQPNKTKQDRMALRQYQEDLASSANKGENVIICAPTGSGKTRVAANVIYTRFNQELGERDPKVAFIVPRVALAKQQHDNIKSYLYAEKWCVDYLIGDSKTTLKESLQSSNVVVMTPQILLNALKDGSVPSLKVFKLLVLDECHHTMKENPYNIIMLHYLGLKDEGFQDLPQIVGLTATLGVGKGKLDASAIDHMMTLCANLDATGGISTVPLEHKDELYRHTPQPEEDNVFLDDTITDPFTFRLCGAIDELVEILYSLNIMKIKGTTRPHALPKGDQQYIQWCQDFKTKAVHSLSDDPDLCKNVQTCIGYLRDFNESLDLHFKCRAVDALKFLENRLNKPYHSDLLSTESRLHETSHKIIILLKQDLNDPRCVNPNLIQIQKEISQTFQKDKNSRVMLNVLKRQYAEPIRDWLNESSELRGLKLNAEYFTGVGKGRDGGVRGLTHNKQEQILEMFRSGATKVLVCTPAVASEGLDIVDCNLVICYDYVKNEVSKLQVKGRARKEGGRMVQFSSRKVMARDKVNIAKTLLMEKTTQIVQTMFQENKQQYLEKLLELQKNAVLTDRITSKYKTEKKNAAPSNKFNVICKKCSEHICLGDAIVKVEGTNHTCVANAFKIKYNSRIVEDGGTEEKKGLFCKKCDSQWGITSRYKRVVIPQLFAKAFKFVANNGSSASTETGKQWSKIAIEFKRVTYEEIRNMIDRPGGLIG